jgi:hypothetical protein
MFVMKIESSSNLKAQKAWRVCETRKTFKNPAEASDRQDLYLACLSFLVLLCFAVADAAFKI